MDNILSFTFKTPEEVALQVARRVRERRLELNLTQEAVALRSGVKLPTYRRFERSGVVSFKALLHIAFALNMLEGFDELFTKRQYGTLDELIENKHYNRKRGHKNE